MSRLPSVKSANMIARCQEAWVRGLAAQRLANYRAVDKRKGFTNDLDDDFFTDICHKPCVYCGTVDEDRGLDRIDNNKGHTKDNVLPCCCLCNLTRADRFSVQAMLEFIGPAIRAARLKGLTVWSNWVGSRATSNVPQTEMVGAYA